MAEKKTCAQELTQAGLSVIAACRLISLPRASFYRKNTDWKIKDAPVIETIYAELELSPRAEFWKCFHRMRNKMHFFNHKRVYRVYCRLGLNLKRRVKKKLPERISVPLIAATQINEGWAMDFVSDNLYCGKRFRTLNIIDESTRECLAIEIDTSLPAEQIIRVLSRLKEERGLPKYIRVDNGPEFISDKLVQFCTENGVTLNYIQPGKPQQNAFIEHFNGSFRREFLDAYLFESLSQVKEMAWFWMQDYNRNRTHESLNNLPPELYRKQLENSNQDCFRLGGVDTMTWAGVKVGVTVNGALAGGVKVAQDSGGKAGGKLL